MSIRKVYGFNHIRYLRCRAEFSERKKIALRNTKVPEAKAVPVSEHLAEGCSLQGIARLVKMDPYMVRRLSQRMGNHGQVFHDERVSDIKAAPCWWGGRLVRPQTDSKKGWPLRMPLHERR